jgi:hypothetical protein
MGRQRAAGRRRRHRAATRAVLALMCPWAAACGIACALPHTAISLLEGRTVLLPGDAGEPRTVVRLTVLNQADVPLESIRVRIAFASAPGARVAPKDWRESSAWFAAPLAPGAQGVAVLEDPGGGLYPNIEIIAAVPQLRIAANGHVTDLSPAPYVWQGVVFGPIAQTARNLGMAVCWSEDFQLATFDAAQHSLVVQLGSDRAIADGRPVRLRGALREVRGALVGPVEATMRLLGAPSTHVPDTNVLNVTYP